MRAWASEVRVASLHELPVDRLVLTRSYLGKLGRMASFRQFELVLGIEPAEFSICPQSGEPDDDAAQPV